MARTITIKKMAIVSLMTAILCILSPVSIPIFISPVPVSLGVLAIYLTAYVLEPVESLVSVVLFLLLGIFGLPVFSGYSGGVAKILGPTGGYLVGFLFTVYISSFFIHLKKGIIFDILGMILGLALCYQQGKGFLASLLLCVVPFLLGDAIKIAVASIIGSEISKRLDKINL